MKKILLIPALLIFTFGFGQTPITDANFNQAIQTCLSTNPIDGMCSDSEYGAMPDWDVSQVTDMHRAFFFRNDFNADLSAWDVSNVTDMSGMFNLAESFNQDISNWDVSSVTDINAMFSSASSFDQPLNNWDVSGVTNMARMFSNAFDFNQPLNNWDVGNVTDMYAMFGGANSFNQDLSNWDVSNVTDMGYMFVGTAFNQDIGSWDVSNVTDMNRMFSEASSFNQPVGNWNVSNVNDMNRMFNSAVSFNQDIGDWDVSNVTDMRQMFYQANVFNQPIGNWNVSNVTDMNSMFVRAYAFNQDISNWDVSSVTTMNGMFSSAQSFNQPIGDWDVSNVTDMTFMFVRTPFNQPIGNWDVSSVNEMDYMFYEANDFNQPIGNWDVSSVTNMYRMFYQNNVFNQPIGNWNVSNVTNMNEMFSSAFAFNQDISNWCVTNIPSEPSSFSSSSPLTESNKPVWGACPSICISTNSNVTFLPDGSGDSYETAITVDCFEPDQVLENVNQLQQVCMVIEHSYLGDLDIELIAPSGQIVLLQGQGGGSANLGIPWATGAVDGNSNNTTQGVGSQYCFSIDDTLPSLEDVQDFGAFPAGDGPGTYNDNFIPAGTYSSDESLAGLVGTLLNGEWRVRITDFNSSDNGYLFSWSLEFDYNSYPVLGVVKQNQSEISIYPNPVKNMLTIDGLVVKDVVIYSVLGKAVLKTSNKNTIDVSSLSKGVYFINVSDGINASTKKFIKD
jgi:surface protein